MEQVVNLASKQSYLCNVMLLLSVVPQMSHQRVSIVMEVAQNMGEI